MPESIRVRGRVSSFLSDSLYLKIRYLRRLKKWPDTKKPSSFNEKLLIYKLSNKNNNHFTRLADKIAAKEFVRARLGDAYVTPVLWSGDDAAKIPFERLGHQPYIIKSAHGSAQRIKVADPSTLNKAEVIATANSWLGSPYGVRNREYQYWEIPRRILIEPMLSTTAGHIPKEYKIFVFGGVVRMIQVDTDGGRAMCDRHWNQFGFGYKKPRSAITPEPPECLHNMIRAAETLASDLEFARVDLYDIDGKVRFSEITFTPESGMGRFAPASADEVVGGFWPKSGHFAMSA